MLIDTLLIFIAVNAFRVETLGYPEQCFSPFDLCIVLIHNYRKCSRACSSNWPFFLMVNTTPTLLRNTSPCMSANNLPSASQHHNSQLRNHHFSLDCRFHLSARSFLPQIPPVHLLNKIMPSTTAEALSLVNRTVSVAPLVLLSATDHYARSAKGTKKRVVGVLLGQNDGKNVRVSNSFAGMPSTTPHVTKMGRAS